MYLPTQIKEAYQQLPRAAKKEVRDYLMAKLNHATPRGIEMIIAQEKEPTPFQFATIITKVEEYAIFYGILKAPKIVKANPPQELQAVADAKAYGKAQLEAVKAYRQKRAHTKRAYNRSQIKETIS